jgi:diguanylate cyclase (GGDEF)-like protein
MTLRFDFSIKAALILLVTICIVPASLIAVSLLSYDYLRARDAQIDSTVTTARTIAYSVDKEFSSIEAALRALATSPSLSKQDLRAFYAQMSDAQSSGLLQDLVLSMPSGKQLLNSSQPYGERLPIIAESTNLHLLDDTNGPVISRLVKDAISNQATIIVSIPVRRAGKHLYNLSAYIAPNQFARLLKQQQLAPDWIVAIIDSQSTIVARTHDMARFSGKQAAPGLLEAMKFDNEGWFEGTTSEGTPVLGMFSRSAVSNWSVAIGIPSASLTGEMRTKVGWLAVAILVLLVSSLGVASYVATRIAQAVRGLRAPALALGQGENVVIPSLRLKEANEVGAALCQASLMLRTARHQATHDVLTGLPNRALFNDLVNRQIAISALASTHFSVLYIDLDGFKPVNDIHGHAAGDAILCEVAARLRGELRDSDMAARLGGDEFAVILVGTAGSAAAKVADNLIRAVSKPYAFKGEVVRISASIGVAGYPEAGAVDHELLRMADLAMYQAKDAGKGRVICAGPQPEHQPVTIKLC